MNAMLPTLAGLVLSTLALEAAAAPATGAPDCRVGIYRLDDGRNLDVGPGDAGGLRWRLDDGTTGALARQDGDTWTSTLGWTGRPDGERATFDCDAGAIDFSGTAGERIALPTTDVAFQGAGVPLAGRLVMPAGDGPVPIVVLVHGSEHSSARETYSLQRQLPAQGIGVFVYDKRGTGASGGEYTQNYLLLANDAIAAKREALRLAGDRAGTIGYQAGSQGGWVAPLAARIEPVDFVIVGFGLAVSPLDEDRAAIALDMASHGYGPGVVDKAMEVADATGVIIQAGFRDGYDALDAVRARYGKEPWFEHVRGNISFYLLENTEATVRAEGPALLPGVPATYDPMPVLRNLDVPQLWLLAEDDRDAPSAETARRLRALAGNGRPIEVVVFPGTDHGLYEYETTPDGNRMSTRHPADYLGRMVDFIRHNRAVGL